MDGLSHEFYAILDGIHWKARLVAGGHQTENHASVLTYASIVSIETVRIARISSTKWFTGKNK